MLGQVVWLGGPPPCSFLFLSSREAKREFRGDIRVGGIFFETRLYACISLSRREWPIDLHIVDTKRSAGNPWITNKVHNTTQKARTREVGDPPLDNPSN
jgi:hypothetical protein